MTLAGLESGAIGPDHTVTCNGTFQLGDHTWYCDAYKNGGHGTLGLIEGIARSCDVYFYDVGNRTGIDAIAATAHRLGLGAKTGLDMPGEHTGIVPSTAWKKARYNQPCMLARPSPARSPGSGRGNAAPDRDHGSAAGERSRRGAPCYQGGRRYRAEQTAWPPLDCRPEHVAIVLAGMRAATDHGTGKDVQIKEPGMQMAGKTGTAQVHEYTLAEHDKSRIAHVKATCREAQEPRLVRRVTRRRMTRVTSAPFWSSMRGSSVSGGRAGCA